MGSVVGSIDGAHGWARNLWNMLAEGGVWMVPRSCMALTKRNGQLIVDRMPWAEESGVSQEDWDEAQDADVQGIRDMFAAVGVEVVEP